MVLTFALTVASGGFVLLMPELQLSFEGARVSHLQMACLQGLLLLLVCAYAVIECALTSALAGKGPGMYLPGGVIAFLRSGLRFSLGFFAGPIVPLAVAGYFWLFGGDLTRWDCLIVAELLTAALAYWLAVVVCAAERDRLRDATPLRVGLLLHRLGRRAVVPVLIAPALAYAHAAVGVLALSALHRHTSAWLLLAGCWASGLFVCAALFRLLGVWCCRNRARMGRQGP